ncbi:MAG: low molecular weight phosphotyrosine protein phosphatase [Actinobacteria bacterium]|nr:low molecular weight phosphotyrosine protein phosphatase [Actinomycetota bacterium]MSX89460.1 low molecular weight phosphotyrosine protein phosphatase [Actinomycetota bacterium]MSZ64335.1 low molecular weight phosphotyrosine protein phosphatase [Actinomycetota bacterium]MTA58500.1 low molecular weight phosphotyrosine protein phosphatase [Actinomycetota bacterium]
MLCMGNICRSPMAAAVLSNRTTDWDNPEIVVDSAGTGAWHIGQSAHPTSEKVWKNAGYTYSHSARQFQSSDFYESDLILVMDSSNFNDAIKLAADDESREKVFYLRSFDPSLASIDPTSEQFHKLEVPDPYNQSIQAYEEVLFMVERCVDGLLQELKRQ